MSSKKKSKQLTQQSCEPLRPRRRGKEAACVPATDAPRRGPLVGVAAADAAGPPPCSEPFPAIPEETETSGSSPGLVRLS